MSHPLHPADPANADSVHITPNLNQPNAPLPLPSPYTATSTIGLLNDTNTQHHEISGPVGPTHVNPNEIAFSNNQNIAPVQFLDPTALTYPPVATQALLHQTSQGTVIAKGTPEWQAAREQVMKSVGASPAPDIILQAPKRGRPRGRPRKHPLPVSVTTHADLAGSQASAETLDPPGLAPGSGNPTTAPNGTSQPLVAPMNPSKIPTRGRGRPRSRGGRIATRGGKIGKRKRGSDEDNDSENNTSDSESHILESTAFTRSGRTVSKPTAFTPILPTVDTGSGSGTPRNKKRVYRGGLETALCMKCDRGHSTISNVIVFCDGCNRAWHQWCHDPHISREVVDVPERAWFCTRCAHEREMEGCPLEKRIGGDSLALSMDETDIYLSTLSSSTLRHLLLRAVDLHPDLPIFAPNTPQLIKHAPRPSLPPPKCIVRTTLGNGVPPATSMLLLAQGNHRPPLPPGDSITSPRPSSSSINIINNAHLTAPTSPAQSTSTLSSDPYFDYDNSLHDPPFTYPRPGTGPIPLRPTTDEDDRMWLEGKEEDNQGVFSHLVRDESTGALKALIAETNGERLLLQQDRQDSLAPPIAPTATNGRNISQALPQYNSHNKDIDRSPMHTTGEAPIQSPEVPSPMQIHNGDVNGADGMDLMLTMPDTLPGV